MVRQINIIETFMGHMDMNPQLYDGLARKKRSYEFDKIFSLHMEFMKESNKREPDKIKLQNLFKQVCIYAQLAMLPDDERSKLFESNRVENRILFEDQHSEGQTT